MRAKLPAYARMATPAVHAPGLFRSPSNENRDKYIRIEYAVGPLLYKLAGPTLGPAELRALQGLIAFASQHGMPPPMSARSSEESRPLFEKVDALLAHSAHVSTTYNELARCVGYADNSGSTNAILKKALELLCSVSVVVGRSAEPKSKDASVGHMIQGMQSRAFGETLDVQFSPVLAAALLGTAGTYLRLDMDEVRKLKSDPARLLHQRLHWINAGSSRPVGVDTLCGYVWAAKAESASTQRTRRQKIRLAVCELVKLLGWSAATVGPSTYSIGRPAVKPRPAGTRTASLSKRRHQPALTQTHRCRQDNETDAMH